MSDKLKIQMIEEIDFEDIEECIAKDYRHYVKLKSREEPYEVDEDTYERVLAWIAKVNAESDELKPCPFCGAQAKTIKNRTHSRCWYVGCLNDDCLMFVELQLYTHATEEDAIAAWNRRAQ